MPSALQAALSAAQSAQNDLNQLELRPTPAELAAARAEVASAEAALAELERGLDAGDIRAAELGVQSAQIALESAKLDLSNARVLAPIDGVVLSVTVELGQQGSGGDVVATIADPSQLRLVANVEQKDINFIQIGQQAEITVYGLTGQVYHGVVEMIAPHGESGTGSITFPVTLSLTDESLADLKPGMNATANFIAEDAESSATEGAEEESS
jgi:HlyD family secretion protein